LVVAWWTKPTSHSPETVFEPPSRIVEPAPLCPWRQPESDLPIFFPEATRFSRETKVLSGQRLQLQERLGRPATAEENALAVYRVFDNDTALGSVLTRRAKGENGAIEMVLAIDRDQTIRHLRLQRIREPDSIAQALQDPRWLGTFAGMNERSTWPLTNSIPGLPQEAQASGYAVVEGVRSLLVLMALADKQNGLIAHH
jgi:hypothetical protein